MPERHTTSAALAEDFRLLSDTLYATNDVDGAFAAIVGLATRTIDGCDWAGLSRVGERSGHDVATVAASDPVVQIADQLQNELREGPCLDAVSAGSPVQADEVDARWPAFGPAARRRTPIRSALSLAVGPSSGPAALTLYSGTPGAFTADAVDTVTLFGAHAQVLLMLIEQSDRITRLTDALTTSRLIGNAVGILMYAHRITSDEAFDRLSRASRGLHRKLADLAAEVTSSGDLPRARPARTAPASLNTLGPTGSARADRDRLTVTHP